MVTVNGNSVRFSFFRPQAKQAHIVGDFNEWSHSEIPMARSPKGYWKARVELPVGTFKFRYHADGEWFTDYAAFGLECGQFGPDSIIRVGDPDWHG